MTAEERHERLVSQASNGDPQSIEELLVTHLPQLVTYVRLHAGNVVLDRESCSDLAQSVCRELLGKLEHFEYRGMPAFRAYLFEAAKNKILQRVRGWNAQQRDVNREAKNGASFPGAPVDAVSPLASPSEEAMREEDFEALSRAIDTLSERQREILMLSKFIGYSAPEIAGKLEMTPENVRTTLHRTLFEVSKAMDRHLHGAS